jgi:hypothetical protein
MKASGRSAAIRTSYAMACSVPLPDAHAERIDPLLLEGLASGEPFEKAGLPARRKNSINSAWIDDPRAGTANQRAAFLRADQRAH